MSPTNGKKLLHIKKYPNRRFYDTTRSQHVTLNEIYKLIQAGYDVRITETRGGADITNLILLQIVLDREHPKLDLFPSAILHLMIRSRPKAFQNAIERYFGPFLGVFAESRKQFDDYARQAFGPTMAMPLQWANSMVEAFASAQPTDPVCNDDADDTDSPPASPSEEALTREESIDELRQQAAALLQRIDNLTDRVAAKPPEDQ